MNIPVKGSSGTPSVMVMTDTGVPASFPPVKKYVKKYALVMHSDPKRAADLASYAAGKKVLITFESTGEVIEYGPGMAATALRDSALEYYQRAILAALRGEAGWLTDWRHAVALDYWGIRGDHAWHKQALKEFEAGHRQQKTRMLYLMLWGYELGNCLTLGWFDYAVDLARRGQDAFEQDLFVEGAAENKGSRMHLFLIRLVSQWQAWRPRPLDAMSLEGTPYADILTHWRGSAEEIKPALLAACDRHTQQSHVNVKGIRYELWLERLWYVPCEITAVLRLRESLGLENPDLDHPLMNTALGKLQPVTPPHEDALISAVVARISKQLSEMNHVS